MQDLVSGFMVHILKLLGHERNVVLIVSEEMKNNQNVCVVRMIVCMCMYM